MSKIGLNIDIAAQYLSNGEVVAIPTETVYGLAANALNPKAVVKIFDIKERPSFDPLIIHTDSPEKALLWVKEIPAPLQLLMDKFCPGPITFLLPKRDIIPDIVTSGLKRVAIRFPSHTMTNALLEKLDYPLAAPSANPFGYISPTTAAHVDQQLGAKIPYILDGGSCSVGIESTIVGMEGDKVIIYRKGGMSIEKIEEVVGEVEVRSHSSSNPASPGMLKSHYAPKAKVLIGEIDALTEEHKSKKIAVLSFKKKYSNFSNIVLSAGGDLAEAASRLFGALRELDALNVEIIVTEKLPEEGLGRAINDRLARASA